MSVTEVTTIVPRHSEVEILSTPSGLMGDLSPSKTTTPSVLPGTSTANPTRSASSIIVLSTLAPIVAKVTTTLLNGARAACPSLPISEPPHFPLTDELLPPPLPSDTISTHPEILNCICTPYDADAFDAMFDKFPQLCDEFPHLMDKLQQGFPMGAFSDLDETVIHPNKPPQSPGWVNLLDCRILPSHQSKRFTQLWLSMAEVG
jgi:hypothetical protein